MSTFVIWYRFDSFHTLCLRSKDLFPHRYTFAITPESLYMDHEFKVEFDTYANGPRIYTIRLSFNNLGPNNQINDMTSITLSHHYREDSNQDEKINKSVIKWEKEIDTHRKEICDFTMQKYEMFESSKDRSSDQSLSTRIKNIEDKIKEHVKAIKTIESGTSEIEFNETVYVNEITHLPRFVRGSLTNFAKDLNGTFWWHTYPDPEPDICQTKNINIVATNRVYASVKKQMIENIPTKKRQRSMDKDTID
jgi:hypothetical protein